MKTLHRVFIFYSYYRFKTNAYLYNNVDTIQLLIFSNSHRKIVRLNAKFYFETSVL